MTRVENHWQNLFPRQAPPGAGTIIRWRVLRKGGEPLLVLPATATLAARSLALYPAQTMKARLLRRGLRWALKWNLPLPLAQASVALDSQAAFARFLTQKARTPTFPLLAVYAGNPHAPGRRFILLLFGPDDQPVCVVKAGITPAAVDLIERERAFLASAQTAVAGVPKLLGQLETTGLAAFAMEFLEGDSPSADNDELTGRTLSGWVREDREVILGETSPWRQLEAACPGHPLMSRLAKLRACCVRRVIWHGDFAPWNIKLDLRTGRSVVLDWERGQLAGPPGWDWFHFALQPGILVGKRSAPELKAILEHLLQSGGFAAYADRCGIRGQERPLALAYLLYCLHVLKPSEGGAPTRALLTLLAESWTEDSKS